MMCPVLIKFKWSNVKCWTCNATSIIHNGQVFCFGPRCFQNLFQRSSMAVMSFGWFLNFFTLPDVSARICKDFTGHLTNQVNLWFDKWHETSWWHAACAMIHRLEPSCRAAGQWLARRIQQHFSFGCSVVNCVGVINSSSSRTVTQTQTHWTCNRSCATFESLSWIFPFTQTLFIGCRVL